CAKPVDSPRTMLSHDMASNWIMTFSKERASYSTYSVLRIHRPLTL
ncbi:hypothetical protein ACUXG4_006199, partial [Cupriavidus metallidurans]